MPWPCECAPSRSSSTPSGVKRAAHCSWCRLLPRAPGRPVERGHGAVHRGAVVARVEQLVRDVGVRHGIGRHQAAGTQLEGLDAQLPRGGVQHQLQRKAHAGAGHAPVGQDRRLVGGGRSRAAAEVVHHVGAGQDGADLRGLQAGAEGIRRVGARVDHRVALDAHQPAVCFHLDRDVVRMLAAVGIGAKLLAPVLDPAHRPAEVPRQPGAADLFRQQQALVAKAAADVGRYHAHLSLVQAQAFGQAGAVDVRQLRGRVHHQLVQPVVPPAQHGPAFQRRHALARGAQPAAQRAAGPGAVGHPAVDAGLGEHVVGPVLVQAGGGGHRRVHVGQHRQFGIVDRHLGGDVLGTRAAGRDAGSHQLTHEAHLALGQRVLHRALEARQGRRGKDRLHADQVGHGVDQGLQACRLADAVDACVGYGRPHERHLQRVGQADVGHVLASAQQQSLVFLAGNALADALGGHLGARFGLGAQQLRCGWGVHASDNFGCAGGLGCMCNEHASRLQAYLCGVPPIWCARWRVACAKAVQSRTLPCAGGPHAGTAGYTRVCRYFSVR